MVKNIERRVSYYVETDTGDQVNLRHKWTFLIINQPTEIKRIKQKIYEQLAMVSDYVEHHDFQIPDSSGLHCLVFSLLSQEGKLKDKSEIYASKNFKKSRDLSVRRSELGWAKYISGLIN